MKIQILPIIHDIIYRLREKSHWELFRTDFRQKWSIDWNPKKAMYSDSVLLNFGLQEIYTIIIIWPQMKFIYNETKGSEDYTRCCCRKSASLHRQNCSTERKVITIWIGIGSSNTKSSFINRVFFALRIIIFIHTDTLIMLFNSSKAKI